MIIEPPLKQNGDPFNSLSYQVSLPYPCPSLKMDEWRSFEAKNIPHKTKPKKAKTIHPQSNTGCGTNSRFTP